MNLREPPTNVAAEQMLLGALLANNKALERVEEFLRENHFADPLHGRIYGLICEGVAENRVVDAVSLKHRLGEDRIQLDADHSVTPSGYLAQLLGSMVGILNAGEYGRTIFDCWMRRCLIEAGETMVLACYDPPSGGAPAILEAHEATLLAIIEGAGDVAPAIPVGEAVHLALEATTAASGRVSGLAGLTTGYAAIDRMTAGMMPQQLILLGARPSMGKTALGLGIAIRAAAAGAQTLFWSGEMAAAQLGARIAAAHAHISTTAVFTGRHWDVPETAFNDGRSGPLDAGEWSRLLVAEKAAKKLPLHFDTRAGVTVQALRARARRMRRAKKLDLLVVDYVGLLRPPAEGERQKLYEQVTMISRSLKALATELDIPVLVMAQLNRVNESREDKMPQLSDLRDSGALEQDANVVMFLHRPHYYFSRATAPGRRDSDSDEKFAQRAELWRAQRDQSVGEASVSVAKNRNGPTGNTRLRFHDPTSWFRDEGEADDGPAWMQTL